MFRTQSAQKPFDLFLPVLVPLVSQLAKRQLVEHHDECADLFKGVTEGATCSAAHGICEMLFGLWRRAAVSCFFQVGRHALFEIA